MGPIATGHPPGRRRPWRGLGREDLLRRLDEGSAALLLAIRALAAAEGVDDVLLAEWATSISGLADRSVDAARQNAPKAWRFVGEMHEIADSFTSHGLPSGFAEGAAEVYRRLDAFKDGDGADLDEVIDAIVHPAARHND